jgi:hypothetical protein
MFNQRVEGELHAYGSEQWQVGLAAAVGGDVLDGVGGAAADDDLRAVREALVGGVPAPGLQIGGRLHPVAIAVVGAGREVADLSSHDHRFISHLIA